MSLFYRRVAQLAELRFPKPSVGGSSPSSPATPLENLMQELNNQVRKDKTALKAAPPKKSSKTMSERLSGLMVFLSLFSFLFGFYLSGSLFFAGSASFVRFFIIVLGCSASVLFLWLSEHRERLLALIKGARIELYKVFWPTRDEAVKTTLLVLFVVTLFALFFTLIDALLTVLIKWVL